MCRPGGGNKASIEGGGPVKIAMVSEQANPLAGIDDADAGGQNVHVAALATALVRRGHDVRVFTRRDDPAQQDKERVAWWLGLVNARIKSLERKRKVDVVD